MPFKSSARWALFIASILLIFGLLIEPNPLKCSDNSEHFQGYLPTATFQDQPSVVRGKTLMRNGFQYG